MMHHHGSTNNLDFGKLDDEQLMSMFFDDDDLRGSKGSGSAEECKRWKNRRRCRTMSGRWAGSAPRISSMIERRKRMMSGKIGSWRDPVMTSVEFQRQLQRLQIGEQDQQAMYRRKNDDNLVGGYTSTGDYYVQKMPEKAPPVTTAPPAGYWPEKQVTSGGFSRTRAPEQPMYMFTSAMEQPMVRQVTGPPGHRAIGSRVLPNAAANGV
ncbi:hypothetical protein EV1_032550 [Malus domestica]